jgi:hypothetical protein
MLGSDKSMIRSFWMQLKTNENKTSKGPLSSLLQIYKTEFMLISI